MAELPPQETAYDRDLAQQERDDDALLRVARERFRVVEEAEADFRREAKKDLQFLKGEQWDSTYTAERDQEGRPALVINRLPQFQRQVTNEIRQNRPSIKVSPVDSQADPKTAEIIQDWIRHIWEQSDANVAIDTAAEAASGPGRGYYRVLTQYLDERSFEQTVRIERIRNSFMVYMDVLCQRVDYSDARYCFVVERQPLEVFKQDNPGIHPDSIAAWMETDDAWVQRDTVRVAEYFYKTRQARTLVQLQDGSTLILQEVPPELRAQLPIVQRRETMIETIKWCKINGYAVLERREWPGKWIPVVPILGNELDIDGTVELSGLVRNARDPQRMINYWWSAHTEMIALAPRAPYIGAAGQFAGFERDWSEANRRNMAYLQYHQVDVRGQPAPPPRREAYEPPVQALMQAMLMAEDHLKAATGIFDASLGQRSNETSGVAIRRRQAESDVANYHYPDNTNRSIKHLGRILVDLMQKIVTVPQVLRLLGEDGTERRQLVNAPVEEGQDELGQAIQRVYDVRVGTYDVTLDAGPSYATRRQEAAENMTDFAKAYPRLFEIAGDLMFENFDFAGAGKIAERFRALLPPNVAQLLDGKNPEQQLAQMNSALQQAQQENQALNAYAQKSEQQMQQLAQENEELKQANANKQRELELKALEIEYRHQEALLKIHNDAEKVDLQALELHQTVNQQNGAKERDE